jgi:hypothetical protein
MLGEVITSVLSREDAENGRIGDLFVIFGERSLRGLIGNIRKRHHQLVSIVSYKTLKCRHGYGRARTMQTSTFAMAVLKS